ncbi:MAG: hypothetical protein ACK4P5_08480, partial [Fimbriimonadales bacterium]
MRSIEPLAYARFLVRLGRLDEAVQVAQTSTRAPIFPELLDALLQAGRTEEAERLTLRSPAPETVAQQWARYYAQQGDLAKAVEQIQRAPDHMRTVVQQAVLEQETPDIRAKILLDLV